MSKVVLVCYRNRNKTLGSDVFDTLAKHIIPDNIQPNTPLVLKDKGSYIAVINPNSALLAKNNSVCIGYINTQESNWWQPGTERPDGTFAMFRSDKQFVELMSDTCATRTIWYVITKDVFIASTSQRAIVYFLQDFQPNHQTILWMLPTGNIGPGLSWDKRIRCLKGNSSLILNRVTWNLEEKTEKIEFNPIKASYKEHKKIFMDALDNAFNQSHIDFSKWHLLLSGGYDSRCILLMLKNKIGLNCVTWGLKSALDNKKSDAAVAKELANHFRLNHTYHHTDVRNEDLEQIFHRLLVAGEGRTDAISGYMDGFDIWKHFFQSGISGVIRGDALSNPPNIYTEDTVKIRYGMSALSNYCNHDKLKILAGEKRYWPEQFYRRERETFITWCSRMSYEFRAPTYWAALNEVKSPYVEVMNPLLTLSIVKCYFQLPDPLRNDNTLYWDIIRTLSPNIAFAEHSAIAKINDILRTQPLVSHLAEILGTNDARDLLTDELVNFTLKNMKTNNYSRTHQKSIFPAAIKKVIPARLRKFINRKLTPAMLDPNILALRAYIIYRMNTLLSEDAKALKKSSQHKNPEQAVHALYLVR